MDSTSIARRRFIRISSFIGVASILIGACAAPAAAPNSGATNAPAASKAKEKILVVAVDGDVDTFDPCCTVGTKPSQTTIQNTFDQLTQYAQTEKKLANGQSYIAVDTSKIDGMLAEKWEMAPDGKITFTIRKGLKFADGEPITAQAIADGYRRIYEVGGISSFLLIMGGIDKPEQITADGDKVIFVPKQANTLVGMNNVMHNTSAISPKDIKARATDKDKWAAEYFKKSLAAGSGPFVLETYKSGDQITLKARDDYFGGRAKIDKVIQKIVPDPQQRILLLKRGDVDMIMVPPVKDLDELEKDPNIKVLSIPSTNNWMLEMNNKIAPFDNKKVRQAFAYAIPYDTLIKQVYYGRATRLKSPIAEGTPTSDYSFWKYETDPAKAKALLAEAGFADGKGLPAIKLSIRVGSEEDERAAVIIQDALKQIGVSADIEKLAFAAFNEKEQKRELQLFIDQWISWVNDPYYHLSWIYSSGSPTIYGNYKNDEVDKLIAKYTLWAGDPKERDEASKKIQQLIVDDVPNIYLAALNFNVAMRSNISGYAYYNDELNRYYYMDKN